MYAFSQTALTFVSQNYGARQYGRLDRITLITVGCAFVTGLVLGNLCSYFGANLVRIYDARPEVVASGVTRFQLICRYYFICGMMDAMVGVIRGLGVSITPTVVSLVGVCGARLLWVFTIFQQTQFHTEYTLFLSYPISWTVTLLAHVVCYLYIRRRIRDKVEKRELALAA